MKCIDWHEQNNSWRTNNQQSARKVEKENAKIADDLEIERQKIQKEITRLEGSLAGIEKKLSNEKFVANAAPEVVEKERAKQKDWLDNIGKLKEILNNLN